LSAKVTKIDESGVSTDIAQRATRLRDGARQPFDADVLKALGSLSSALMKEVGASPAFVALGFWLRPSALEAYKRDFMAGLPPKTIASPRGLTFHLPPTNVDTIFVYSWALSLLVGNANLVRLPSASNDALVKLMKLVRATLDAHGLADSNTFLTWPQDGPDTAEWSRVSDTRVIWGGDKKVLTIGAMPMRPGGVTIPFPDRYSYALLDAAAYNALAEDARDKLAEKAYNDIFLFDQMACSSSRVFFWLGGEAAWRPAAEDLAKRIADAARRRSFDLAPSTRVAKFLFAHQAAIDVDLDGGDAMDPMLTSLYTTKFATLDRTTQGGGVLFHAAIDKLDKIAPFVEGRDQTLTHFGVDIAELTALAMRLRGRGIDRIVPIGEALQFDRVWDGFDLLRGFSKLVVVR
jgi:hypothetical protein